MRERLGVERERVEPGEALESVAAGKALERRVQIDRRTALTAAVPLAPRRPLFAGQRARRQGDEALHLRHDGARVPGRGVHLEQGELRIVRRGDLAVAKDERKLVDAREPFPGEQALHRILGTRVEVQLAPTGDAARGYRRVRCKGRLQGP